VENGMNGAGEERQEFVDTPCDHVAVEQGVRGAVMGMNLAGKMSPIMKMTMTMKRMA